jgi:hypothetical protein
MNVKCVCLILVMAIVISVGYGAAPTDSQRIGPIQVQRRNPAQFATVPTQNNSDVAAVEVSGNVQAATVPLPVATLFVCLGSIGLLALLLRRRSAC